MKDAIIEVALAEMAKQVGDIYHFTNHKAAENIIDSGHIKSQYNHISATRNYNLPMDSDNNSDVAYSKGFNTRITLDGNKISEHHKVKPLLGVTANVSDPHDIKYNNHRVSRHEHENEENIKSNMLPISGIVKHVHVAPDSIDALDHYHTVLRPKLDKLGISNSVGKKFHRSDIKEDSIEYQRTKLNESFEIILENK